MSIGVKPVFCIGQTPIFNEAREGCERAGWANMGGGENRLFCDGFLI